MENLFDDAAATARRELGISTSEPGPTFASWRNSLAQEIDLANDSRMMVPVFYDRGRKKMKVWALLGWRNLPATLTYESTPTVVSLEQVSIRPEQPGRKQGTPERQQRQPGRAILQVLFSSTDYTLASPVMHEVYVTHLLNRDEFRRHCDRWRTPEAILSRLT